MTTTSINSATPNSPHPLAATLVLAAAPLPTPARVVAASPGPRLPNDRGHRFVRRVRLRFRLARRRLRALMHGETGAETAEYAVATMAAVGFAGLLVVILRGDEVRGILTELVRNALSVG